LLTEADILYRAHTVWPPGTVPYSQSNVHQPDGYRADCSGYVSMCWDTGPAGGNTVNMVGAVMYEISPADLAPGDAIGKCGPGTEGDYGHIQLFEGWAGDGALWIWEQAGGTWGPQRRWLSAIPWGYKPYRFNQKGDEGMSEREAQLAASWTTSGSDQTGYPEGFVEADSVKEYSNRFVEQRFNARMDALAAQVRSGFATVDGQIRSLGSLANELEVLLRRLARQHVQQPPEND
jgi:hypothetical protein